MVKKISLLISLFLIVLSCSIDKNQLVMISSVETLEVRVGDDETHPWGGYYVYFLENGIVVNTIFLSTGQNGQDGINGIDGIDGQDGVSVTVTVEEAEGGYWLVITQGDNETRTFIRDGIDGIDGLDGIDGIDGASVTITTEEVEGGTLIIITQGDTVTEVFVPDGQDGQDGVDGINGIDGVDGQDGASVTITTEETEGGYFIHIYQNNVLISTIFVEDGQDGIDGLDGIDGVDGVDGIDGISTTITTEQAEGGYWLIFLENNVEVTRIFVSDGQDGQDGQDGTSSTITTEDAEGGFWLIITTGDETTRVFVRDGIDGVDGIDGIDGTSVTVRTEQDVENDGYWIIFMEDGVEIDRIFVKNGTDGQDGEDGEDYTNGDGTVTICHKVTHPVPAHPEWGSNTNVTLTLNLSDYVLHIYEYHNGNSSQNDAWGSCE